MHAMQKRHSSNFGYDLLGGIAAVGEMVFYCGLGGAIVLGSSYVTVITARAIADTSKHAYNLTSAYAYLKNSNDECSRAYPTNSPCSNPLCCKLDDIDSESGGRLKYVSDLKKRYEQLYFVEAREVDAFWKKVNRGTTIDSEKYHALFGLIAHKKQCIYHKACIVKNDMPRYREEYENAYIQKLNLATTTHEVQSKVNQHVHELDTIIGHIKHKHTIQGPKKMPPVFKLNNGSPMLCAANKQMTEKE